MNLMCLVNLHKWKYDDISSVRSCSVCQKVQEKVFFYRSIMSPDPGPTAKFYKWKTIDYLDENIIDHWSIDAIQNRINEIDRKTKEDDYKHIRVSCDFGSCVYVDYSDWPPIPDSVKKKQDFYIRSLIERK